MADEASPKTADPKGALPFLDRAVEIKFALLVISVTLAIDVFAAAALRKNLLTLNWTLSGPDISPGLLLIFASTYLLYMSLGSALLMAILLKIAEAVNSIWSKLTVSARNNLPSSYIPSPPADFVSELSLKREAMEQQSSFLLSQVERSESTARTERKEFAGAAVVTVACTALFTADRFLPHTLFSQLSEPASWFFYLVWIATALLLWPYLTDDPTKTRWIFYPPLARRHYNQWRENRDKD